MLDGNQDKTCLNTVNATLDTDNSFFDQFITWINPMNLFS